MVTFLHLYRCVILNCNYIFLNRQKMLLRRVASPIVCSKRTMKEWFGSGSETIKIETPERYIPRVSTYY